ncbi:alpha/beta hydrolase [Carnobacterium gallinarum]|uniref:alpha/beta hydrolase n=1 Tax=Carnobacterium gallinarum TaxID=2749 RepID=UPI0005534F54|nr:alpha/beta fold hydrolase [Carnobacterium gallinarum]
MPKIALPQPFFFENGPRAVLLLHAYTGSSNDMRMLARALEKENYTVYAPHFKGHGTLEPTDILKANPSDWWQDTQDGLAFLHEKGYQDIAVFGLSLGGIFATKAMEEETILGVGTLCSPLYLNENNQVVPTFLRYVQTVKKIAGLSEAEIVRDLPKIKIGVEQQLQAIADYLPPIQHKIAAITKPFFIAQAGQDELIDAQSAYELQEALVQAPVSFHWYENSSHVITVGKEHHALEKDVLTFLNQLSWNEG